MNHASKTALILVDVQRGIDETDRWGGNRNNPLAEHHIERLLHSWRKLKLPVIIVQHCSVSPKSPFRPNHEGNGLKDFVKVFTWRKTDSKIYN